VLLKNRIVENEGSVVTSWLTPEDRLELAGVGVFPILLEHKVVVLLRIHS
tara:strand:+ start:954 stop:1103 length:150 start_codon:yes stop_codon:yes gene_type:complete